MFRRVSALTWAVFLGGALGFAIVWGMIVVTVGEGTFEFWTWSVQSWQAVTTALTGYAIVVLASVQISASRDIFRQQRSDQLTVVKQDTLLLLSETIRAFTVIKYDLEREGFTNTDYGDPLTFTRGNIALSWANRHLESANRISLHIERAESFETVIELQAQARGLNTIELESVNRIIQTLENDGNAGVSGEESP